MREQFKNRQKKLLYIAFVVIVIILPLMIFVAKQRQETRTEAAPPDELEVEGGILSRPAVKKFDSSASGGTYVLFDQELLTSTTYWVSPSGNDSNPGTSEAPWKTIAYAASKLAAGETAIFRDGVYNETIKTSFAKNGTPTSPITMRAEHARKATLMYPASRIDQGKLVIEKSYIVIDGFVLTQEIRGTGTNDVLVRCYGQSVALGGDSCIVKNSEFRNAAIGLKFNSDNSIASDNLFVDMSRTGIDILNGLGNKVINNEVANSTPASYGIYDKGGSRNTLFDSNLIHSSSTMNVGVMLGGSTGYPFVYRPSNTVPSEAFNAVAINNVVISQTPGAIRAAYGMRGCNTCSFSNNISLGSKYALLLADGADPTNSTGQGAWSAATHNPSFVNNIALNCTDKTVQFDNGISGTLTFDYNLLDSCSGVAGPAKPSTFVQAHPRSGDPLFVNPQALDFHLRSGSPALGTGLNLIPFPTFSDANTPPTSPTPRDRNKSGALRSVPWNLGIY